MKTIPILLVLPALVWAKIDIAIVASEDESERQVQVSGTEEDLINDKLHETDPLYQADHRYPLHTETIKDAVAIYFGKRPNDVFLISPTPWNDLYKTNGWKQVHRLLKPLKAEILSVENQSVLVSSHFINNTRNESVTFQAFIRQDVEDTFSSVWEKEKAPPHELTEGLLISYRIDIKPKAVFGKAKMRTTCKWGENTIYSQTVFVGSKTGFFVTLEPNQRANGELRATKGTMRIKIDYDAYLVGDIAVHYEELYKDQNFFNFEIGEVMKAAEMHNSVLSSEVITFDYYSDSEIVVRDSDTNKVLSLSYRH